MEEALLSTQHFLPPSASYCPLQPFAINQDFVTEFCILILHMEGSVEVGKDFIGTGWMQSPCHAVIMWFILQKQPKVCVVQQ